MTDNLKFENYKKFRNFIYQNNCVVNNKICLNDDYKTYLTFDNLLNEIEFKEQERLYRNLRERRKRLYRFIELKIVKCGSYDFTFITLTFDNNVLNNTTKQTRRRYVVRFLKTLSPDYVANIDYGSKNEREHYHALIGISPYDLINNNLAELYKETEKIISVNLKNWSYGHNNGLLYKYMSDNNTLKIAKYIDKLRNHAFKTIDRVIYSKKY